jgi:hypothetical protein
LVITPEAHTMHRLVIVAARIGEDVCADGAV